VSGNGLAVNIIAKVPRGCGFGPQPECCCQALPLSKRQEGIDYGSAYQKKHLQNVAKRFMINIVTNIFRCAWERDLVSVGSTSVATLVACNCTV
jgi:hypothetical protein